ncbi:MAG TPA: hypothetical protein VMU24_02290 [Candidatus Acidoferrales bacterium]|nr:hypothetical protein [Candidatus Acidoferrales bacterium]
MRNPEYFRSEFRRIAITIVVILIVYCAFRVGMDVQRESDRHEHAIYFGVR